MSVNLWTDPAHAQRYLRDRAGYPRREEGYTALAEFIPAEIERVLDLGCGDGEVTARVLALHPDVEAVAVDFSAEMLGRARKRFEANDNVTIVEHDLDMSLPDAWGTFDCVVSAFAIHHVVDKRKRALYGEVAGLLRAGGVFLNLEHVASPSESLHQAFLTSFGIAPENDDPSNKLAPVAEQLLWLRDVGFSDVDCHWKYRELALLGGQKQG